jgi:hypothetical protein
VGKTNGTALISMSSPLADTTMSDKLKEFVRQTIDEMVKKLPPEERLKGLSADEVAQALQALPSETLEALKRKLGANGPSAKHQQ